MIDLIPLHFAHHIAGFEPDGYLSGENWLQTLPGLLRDLLDEWELERDEGQRTLVYQARRGGDTDVSLLQEPGLESWQRFTVPTSLRDVEPSVGLILRPGGVRAPSADWDAPAKPPPKPPEDGA